VRRKDLEEIASRKPDKRPCKEGEYLEGMLFPLDEIEDEPWDFGSRDKRG